MYIMHLVIVTVVLFFLILYVNEVSLSVVPLVIGYELLLGAVACIVSLLSTIEASRGASISWGGYVSPGRRSSSLSPVAIPSSSPVIGCMASAEVHRYWDIVHRWGCIGRVVVLWVLSLLVVSLPVVVQKEGASLLVIVVETLKWGSSREVLF